MKAIHSILLLVILLISVSSLTGGTRPEPESLSDLLSANLEESSKGAKSASPITRGNGNNNNNGNNAGAGGGFYGPGAGFGIPGFGNGWGNGIIGGGYGGGSGGPSGGYSIGGVIKPSVVCKEKGRCYNKRLTCPAKCFTSYSRSGKGYGGGGGGGGCNIDCKKCVASC